jgi:hypothetical protein
MANYLKYSDVPVFADFVTENTTPVISNVSKLFATTEASLSIDPNLQANRFLGKVQTTHDFSLTGPTEAKFSLTFFPLIEKNAEKNLNIQKINQLGFFKLTGNFLTGHQIQISNFLLKKCYLQNYSMKINAYQPISISANFISYDMSEIIGNTLIGTTLGQTLSKSPYYANFDSLHALTTTMEGGTATNIPETKISIDINVDCNRTPIYTLGQKTPNTVVLNSVERTVTIQGENIGQVIDITGGLNGVANISFLPLGSLDEDEPVSVAKNVLKFDINGRIVSQQLSASQNSMVNGRVVIKEIIF